MLCASRSLPLLSFITTVFLVPNTLTATPCKRCLPAAKVFNPGIGIELTLEYGTISSRRHDASIHELWKIAGNSQYRDLILQLYGKSQEAQDRDVIRDGHPTPAVNIASIASYFLDWGFQRKRSLLHQVTFIPFGRELVNLISIPLDLISFISKFSIRPPPRSLHEQEAINVLGTMIRSLASHASSILSTPLNSTGIAVPNSFTAHDTSLAVSALAFAGLGFIPTDWQFDQTASVAGTTSQGIGICPNYRNPMACDSEWLPRETVLVLLFTDAALGLTLLVSGQPSLRKPFMTDELHPELGWRKLQQNRKKQPVSSARIETTIAADPAEQTAAAMRAKISGVLLHENTYLSRVVLMGDQTHQPVFQDALRDALSELQPMISHGSFPVHGERAAAFEENWRMMMMDPVFAGARGAAEMAKRAMESTLGGCLEGVHCYRERGECVK